MIAVYNLKTGTDSDWRDGVSLQLWSRISCGIDLARMRVV